MHFAELTEGVLAQFPARCCNTPRNRLIKDFTGAVRTSDLAHSDYPHLPTLRDGLRTEEVIAAARQSSTGRQWVLVLERHPQYVTGRATA